MDKRSGDILVYLSTNKDCCMTTLQRPVARVVSAAQGPKLTNSCILRKIGSLLCRRCLGGWNSTAASPPSLHYFPLISQYVCVGILISALFMKHARSITPDVNEEAHRPRLDRIAPILVLQESPWHLPRLGGEKMQVEKVHGLGKRIRQYELPNVFLIPVTSVSYQCRRYTL